MAPRCTRTYTAKHEHIFQNNILSGITLSVLLRLLWARRAAVSWRTYGLRVAILLLLSSLNSVLSVVEAVVYGASVRAQCVNERPVFILGHPRTGTTFLHNLLAKDAASFHAPTTLQCGFPSAFLTIAPAKGLLSGLVAKKRPMDNVALSLDTPQEDELAVNQLTGGASPYMPLVFMTLEPEYRPFFAFLELGATAAKSAWCSAFLHFLRKVTLQNDPDAARRLVIKSPVHTARIKLLLELFPLAQFVFLHRHPYDVFRSATHMADSTYWFSYLCTPTDDQINEFVLNQHEVLYREYLAARSDVPEGSLYELSFDELNADGLRQLRSMYHALGWQDKWAAAEPRFREYLAGQATYKKNSFSPLDEGTKALLQERWKLTFDEFGYEA